MFPSMVPLQDLEGVASRSRKVYCIYCVYCKSSRSAAPKDMAMAISGAVLQGAEHSELWEF